MRNKLTADVKKKAKRDYYQDVFDNVKNEPRKVWNAVNEITNRKTYFTCIHQITFENKNIEGKHLANNTNEHCVSVGTSSEERMAEKVTS